jgi:DNA-binding IclR family transcriptional regulator
MLGTLMRAGAVLDLFTTDEPEWGVTATARQLGIGKSLAHDVLASLAAIGLLQRVGHGRYRLGWRTMSLASVMLRTSELQAQARPVVRDLAERHGVAVSLVAWDRGRILYIDRCQPSGRPGGRDPGAPVSGATVPFDGSAAAWALLASRPDDEVRTAWATGGGTLQGARYDELELELARIRMIGWAPDKPAQPGGRLGVSAPVRDSDGVVAAAISLELRGEDTLANIELHARIVVAAAARISQAVRRPVGHLAMARG